MKHQRLVICFLLIVLTHLAKAGETASTKLVSQEKLEELERRLDAKDYTAFSEAADFPASFSIPFLFYYANRGSLDPELAPQAMQAFKRVHGFKEDYKRRLKEISDSGRPPLAEINTLTLIGTHEAAEVVAPYLFDSRVSYDERGNIGDHYEFLAATSLGMMRLPDAPTTKAVQDYSVEDHLAWQKWAISQGLVPKEWESRMGVPEMVRKLLHGNRRDSERLSHETQMPDPTDAKHVRPLNSGWPNREATVKSDGAETIATLAEDSGAARARLCVLIGGAIAALSCAIWILLRFRKKNDARRQ